jgi:hypothetical protein
MRKRSTKGNTREKIRREGHKQKKITKAAKVKVLYWNVAGLRKKKKKNFVTTWNNLR